MITIEKINHSKRIYHFEIKINGLHYESRDNYFGRKKDAQKYIDKNRNKLETEFQADDKIQVSAGKSTNNNPESKTKGENDE